MPNLILFFSSIFFFTSSSLFSPSFFSSILISFFSSFSFITGKVFTSSKRKTGNNSFWTNIFISFFFKCSHLLFLSINNSKLKIWNFMSKIDVLNTNNIISNNSFFLSKISKKFLYFSFSFKKLLINEIILFCIQGEILYVNR